MSKLLKIEDCISFMTSKAHQKITRRARALLSPHGVTPTQYTLLSVLWEQDGRSGAELSERLILDSATMTGLIDRTVTSNLVVRKPDASDRRINRVWLTDHGKNLSEPLNKVVQGLENEIKKLLDGESDDFNEGLKKISMMS